ncbi:MAG: phosphoethanolamine--lipid A transferase [Rubrivivax sp.]
MKATVERIAAIASLFWVLAGNRPFFAAALQGRPIAEPGTWGWLLALAALVFAIHFLLLLLLSNRWTVKPVVAVLMLVTASSSYFMQSYGIVLDPTMVRNVLRTDVAEARELLGWGLATHLALYAGLPLLLLWRVKVVQRPWRAAAGWRAGALAGALVLAAGALMSVFQPMASMMRNHKEMRYLVTPANVLWSTASVLGRDARGATVAKRPLGEDAVHRAPPRPQVLVLVVGETVRAANWGLSGYARPTTPELARLPVINFPDVTACGTNTEVSVPCLFAPVGRRDYDEERIRGSESLLHLLARAGVAVTWRDNQSGCKGVCDGLPTESLPELNPPGLCADGRCLDEGLLVGLDERLARAQGTQVLVLHMLGNHGPSYFRRYPPAFARFQPVCESDDLRQCSTEQIVNAYDNAILYTDHMLARLVEKLQAASARGVDTAMLFVSDHGESLGEKGLYLHGLPYAVAPREQTQVPMVLWLSEPWAQHAALDLGCLRERAARPAAHDHVFHTVLGLLDVGTSVLDPAWDLTAPCRGQRVARQP